MSESHLAPLPWQQANWQRLVSQLADNKLPHALLLAGPKGIGKAHFAETFARLILCLSPVNQVPCGSCKTCLLLQAGSHPDFLNIHPEEKSKVIKIDQVRQLTEFVSKTAQQGRRKVAVIEPAESLNINAANALLKCLEEPAGDTVLLLISHMPSLLMATIRSRCQKLDFAIPGRQQSLAWLEPLAVGHSAEYLLDCAEGAPLAARDLMGDERLEQRTLFAQSLNAVGDHQLSALEAAAKLQSGDPLPLVEALIGWLQLAVKMPLGASGPSDALERALVGKVTQVKLPLVFRLLDKLMLVKKQLLSGSNPNKQLLIEELLMDWHALLRQVQPAQQARHSLLNGLN